MNFYRQKYGVVVAAVLVVGSLGGCAYCAAVLSTYIASKLAAGLAAQAVNTVNFNRYC